MLLCGVYGFLYVGVYCCGVCGLAVCLCGVYGFSCASMWGYMVFNLCGVCGLAVCLCGLDGLATLISPTPATEDT